MPRRRRPEKRKILPDPKYASPRVAIFINKLMLSGKKNTAERIVYKAFDIMESKVEGKTALEIFEKALDNVKPRLEVKSRRVGGATYQVPLEVRSGRQISLAMRWIIGFARERKGKPIEEKLAQEFLAAYHGEGSSVKKREDTHKMAEANKAFAHYRW